jgi:transcriptional regulator with XRE-family HTH domain
MTSDDIRALRKELGLTQRKLAEALKIEVEIVREWERDDHFPTKAHCLAMEALRRGTQTRTLPSRPPTPMQLLADPEFFILVRKLIGHPKLRADVARLAIDYPDPIDTPDH